jgi:hypothetical protein
MSLLRIAPLDDACRPAAHALLVQTWGTSRMVTGGELWDAADLPGFVAWQDERLVGLATYRMQADECDAG